MPTAKLNYTGRKRIESRHAVITLERTADKKNRYTARLDLLPYGFAPDAKVVVEAYRRTTVMRFDHGTVMVPSKPASDVLDEFDNSEAVLFRVYVTAASGRPGVLLGRADKLQPKDHEEPPANRKALLPVEPAELDDEIWRLDFGAMVVLQINSKLPDWRQTAASPQFKALVYPAVLRQVLSKALLVDGYEDDDDNDVWQCHWLQFAKRLPGVGPLPAAADDKDEREVWIEEAAKALARKISVRSMFETEATE
jgi:hypothetical protein